MSSPSRRPRKIQQVLLSELTTRLKDPRKAALLRQAVLGELRKERGAFQGFALRDTYPLRIDGKVKSARDYALIGGSGLDQWFEQIEPTLKRQRKTTYYRPSRQELSEGRVNTDRAIEDTRTYLQRLTQARQNAERKGTEASNPVPSTATRPVSPRRPIHETPVHETPVHETPVHETPVHETPVHEIQGAHTPLPTERRGGFRRPQRPPSSAHYDWEEISAERPGLALATPTEPQSWPEEDGADAFGPDELNDMDLGAEPTDVGGFDPQTPTVDANEKTKLGAEDDRFDHDEEPESVTHFG